MSSANLSKRVSELAVDNAWELANDYSQAINGITHGAHQVHAFTPSRFRPSLAFDANYFVAYNSCTSNAAKGKMAGALFSAALKSTSPITAMYVNTVFRFQLVCVS